MMRAKEGWVVRGRMGVERSFVQAGRALGPLQLALPLGWVGGGEGVRESEERRGRKEGAMLLRSCTANPKPQPAPRPRLALPRRHGALLDGWLSGLASWPDCCASEPTPGLCIFGMQV